MGRAALTQRLTPKTAVSAASLAMEYKSALRGNAVRPVPIHFPNVMGNASIPNPTGIAVEVAITLALMSRYAKRGTVLFLAMPRAICAVASVLIFRMTPAIAVSAITNAKKASSVSEANALFHARQTLRSAMVNVSISRMIISTAERARSSARRVFAQGANVAFHAPNTSLYAVALVPTFRWNTFTVVNAIMFAMQARFVSKASA